MQTYNKHCIIFTGTKSLTPNAGITSCVTIKNSMHIPWNKQGADLIRLEGSIKYASMPAKVPVHKKMLVFHYLFLLSLFLLFLQSSKIILLTLASIQGWCKARLSKPWPAGLPNASSAPWGASLPVLPCIFQTEPVTGTHWTIVSSWTSCNTEFWNDRQQMWLSTVSL